MKTVGVFGTGQLAQLLTHAAYPLGIKTLPFEDPVSLGACDVITIENENVDVKILAELAKIAPVFPKPDVVAVAQDRLLEKNKFQELAIPTVTFAEINSLDDLHPAANIFPCILKTRRFGYDGKGQVVLKDATELDAAWEAIGKVPAILEGFVAFDFEVSLIAARNTDGDVVFYPLSKNTHREGILRVAESPYVDAHLQQLAEDYMVRLFKAFDYVGVLAFEFFVKGKELIANEIAPRVHNSGHATIEGYSASQFENHLRAVLNLPLVKPVLRTPTRMENIIGTFPILTAADYHNAHVYDYGKSERPGRKLGHITFFSN